MRVWHWIPLAIAGTVVSAALALWSAGPSAPDTAPKTAIEEIAAECETATVPPTAKIVVDEQEHDFGFLDPHDQCEHFFIVRNQGGAPLKLDRGLTTCKCTMSQLPKEPVPPGGTAKIRVASKIEQKEGPFNHGAEIITNDPENACVTLRIRGTVRTLAGVDPSRIHLSEAKRGEPHTSQVVIYSQVWERFSLESIQSSLKDVQWKVSPASANALAKLKARSGYQLEVTVPASLPPGDLWESLRATARPEDKKAPARMVVVDLAGTVEGRMTLSGEKLSSNREVQLGTLSPEESAKANLLLAVRDNHRQLKVDHIESDPEFLKVRLAPLNANTARTGLYRVEVEVPSGTPPVNYLRKKGEVRIVTDHPMIPVIRFNVAFAVTSP